MTSIKRRKNNLPSEEPFEKRKDDPQNRLEQTVERVEQALPKDAAELAADKITNAAVIASDKVEEDAKVVAAKLSTEVTLLRGEIETLREVDKFKAKVFVVGLITAVFSLGAFIYLVRLNQVQENGVNAIRTDLEVHRIRNEASHDCLSEKMAQLPTPEQRIDAKVSERFLQEFLGCVTKLAPTIVPPKAPDIRGKGNG
jgi:hypothetical protein